MIVRNEANGQKFEVFVTCMLRKDADTGAVGGLLSLPQEARQDGDRTLGPPARMHPCQHPTDEQRPRLAEGLRPVRHAQAHPRV